MRRLLPLLVLLAAAALPAAAPTVAAPTPQSLQSKLVYVSPSGSDAAACTRQAPCASFDRAYRAVASGGVVVVGGGASGPQKIFLDPTKTSSPVYFLPAPFARPVVRESLQLGDGQGSPAPSNITLVGLRIDGEIGAFTPARHIIWAALQADNLYIRGVQHMLVAGGD